MHNGASFSVTRILLRGRRDNSDPSGGVCARGCCIVLKNVGMTAIQTQAVDGNVCENYGVLLVSLIFDLI